MFTKKRIVIGILFAIASLALIGPKITGEVLHNRLVAYIDFLNKEYADYGSGDSKVKITLKEYQSGWFSSKFVLETFIDSKKIQIANFIENEILHGPIIFDRANNKIEFLLGKMRSDILPANSIAEQNKLSYKNIATLFHYNGTAETSTFRDVLSYDFSTGEHFDLKNFKFILTMDLLDLNNSKFRINADSGTFTNNDSGICSWTAFEGVAASGNYNQERKDPADNNSSRFSLANIEYLQKSQKILSGTNMTLTAVMNNKDLKVKDAGNFSTILYKLAFDSFTVDNVLVNNANVAFSVDNINFRDLMKTINSEELQQHPEKLYEVAYTSRPNQNKDVSFSIDTLSFQTMGVDFSAILKSNLFLNKQEQISSVAKAEITFGKQALVLAKSFFGNETENQSDALPPALEKLKQRFLIETDKDYVIHAIYRAGKYYINGQNPNDDFERPILPAVASNMPERELQFAIWKDDAPTVEKLLAEKIKANPSFIQDKNYLIDAAFMGNTEMLNNLIKLGFSVNAKDESGSTALYWAARNGHQEIVAILLEQGASTNDSNKLGWTALHEAAEQGYKNIAELILNKGCDINFCDNEGQSALHWATLKDKPEIVELLLAKGANTTLQNKAGETALAIANEKGYTKIASMLQKD